MKTRVIDAGITQDQGKTTAPSIRTDSDEIVPREKNLALITLGSMHQFCELPDDVVLAVESSIRSAQAAVSTLLILTRNAPAVYKGELDPRVLYKAFMALHDV